MIDTNIINYFKTVNGPSPNCPLWRLKKDSKKYFDDIDVGYQWISPMREPITRKEVEEYVERIGETNKMHANYEFSPGYMIFEIMGALTQSISSRDDSFFL